MFSVDIPSATNHDDIWCLTRQTSLPLDLRRICATTNNNVNDNTSPPRRKWIEPQWLLQQEQPLIVSSYGQFFICSNCKLPSSFVRIHWARKRTQGRSCLVTRRRNLRVSTMEVQSTGARSREEENQLFREMSCEIHDVGKRVSGKRVW